MTYNHGVFPHDVPTAKKSARSSTFFDMPLNSLWSDGTADLGQYCLTAPSHYLYQYWLIISEVLWYAPNANFTGTKCDIYPWYEFENDSFRISAASPKGHLGNWGLTGIYRYHSIVNGGMEWLAQCYHGNLSAQLTTSVIIRFNYCQLVTSYTHIEYIE